MTVVIDGYSDLLSIYLIVMAISAFEVSHMLCTIIDIRGDYAYVKYQDTGVVSEVAIALLPFGVDVGDKLKFEDFEFSLA